MVRVEARVFGGTQRVPAQVLVLAEAPAGIVEALERSEDLPDVADLHLQAPAAREEHGHARSEPPGRADLEHAVVVCLLCGRDRTSVVERHCACGGAWTTTLR